MKLNTNALLSTQNINYVLFGVSFVLLNSCATLLNNNSQAITIKTNDSTKINYIVQNNDTLKSSSNYYLVSRNSDSITLIGKKYNEPFSTVVKPFKSNAYWWNIYFNYGLGILVDNIFHKSNAYLKKSYLLDDLSIVKEKKGNSKLLISTDYDIMFSSNQIQVSSIINNFMLGIEYYTDNDRFISFEQSFGLYLFSNNPYASINTLSHSKIKYNYICKNIEIGFGLNYIRSYYQSKLGYGISGTNMMGKSFGLQIGYNLLPFNFKDHYYIEPYHNINFKLLFKINMKD